MRNRVVVLFVFLSLGGVALAQNVNSSSDEGKDAHTTTAAPTNHTASADSRLEGEKRFHSNCGRCHLAPPKFPPRMTATIIRHMRVRAMITDEEMRLILKYMTQ
jgi:cytochrome c5